MRPLPSSRWAKPGLAVAAQRHHASGDPHVLGRLLGDRLAARQQLRRVVRDVVAVGVGLDAERAPALQLLAPLLHQLFERHRDLSREVRRGARRSRADKKPNDSRNGRAEVSRRVLTGNTDRQPESQNLPRSGDDFV